MGKRLNGDFIINTDPAFESDGQPHTHDWLPNCPAPLRIKSTQIWIGLDHGAMADLYARLTVLPTNTPVNYFAWDRYGNPNAPHHLDKDFGDNYVEIPPGGGLRLTYLAKAFLVDGTINPSHVHFQVHAWWEEPGQD